ncbi:hypothetical protein [Kitasatospora sp. NPDC085879]|uniref:hypothetical protein n=1 Tax=Kitasatospora sp. NPDC085879 TaxID=3154769 RepID=UPI00342985C7
MECGKRKVVPGASDRGVDGLLLRERTGQNPASSERLAELIVADMNPEMQRSA